MLRLVVGLPMGALRAYLRWTFASTADNLLWGVWLGIGAALPLVSRLVWLPVADGIPDMAAIRMLAGLANVWWWYGIVLLVVVYGVIKLTRR